MKASVAFLKCFNILLLQVFTCFVLLFLFQTSLSLSLNGDVDVMMQFYPFLSTLICIFHNFRD